MFVKPSTPDINVRDPLTGKHLGADGEEKPGNAFWHRRLRDGDIVKATAPKSDKKKGDK